MGTNFYKVRKLTREEKDKAIKAIEEDRVRSIDYVTIDEDGYEHYDGIESNDIKIHLGKRSGGWKFLFNHNDWKYFKDKDSLIEFLNNEESGIIKDEYGRNYTVQEFLKEVEDCEKWRDEIAYDYNSYAEHCKKTEGKYPWWYGTPQDMYVDGLRFSTCTEFS